MTDLTSDWLLTWDNSLTHYYMCVMIAYSNLNSNLVVSINLKIIIDLRNKMTRLMIEY